MGQTIHTCEKAFEDDGAVDDNGIVIGTYLHGIFNNENFRNAFLDYLYDTKNMPRQATLVGAGFEDLAKAVAENVDMERILKMLNLERIANEAISYRK